MQFADQEPFGMRVHVSNALPANSVQKVTQAAPCVLEISILLQKALLVKCVRQGGMAKIAMCAAQILQLAPETGDARSTVLANATHHMEEKTAQ